MLLIFLFAIDHPAFPAAIDLPTRRNIKTMKILMPVAFLYFMVAVIHNCGYNESWRISDTVLGRVALQVNVIRCGLELFEHVFSDCLAA